MALVTAHPDWRVHPDGSGASSRSSAKEDNLGTRLGCNVGPWGDYLIDICDELIRDYDLDGYSFDGNYHPPICYCPACRKAYRDGVERGVAGEDRTSTTSPIASTSTGAAGSSKTTIAGCRQRLKATKPDAVLMSWTTNAGRYGHFLTSPRVMPTRTNRLFDLPMQEWWLDETNQGASVAPAFGAAYLRGLVGGAAERLGAVPDEPRQPLQRRQLPAPRADDAVDAGRSPTAAWRRSRSAGPAAPRRPERSSVRSSRLERWTIGAKPMPWAAMLVSEPTRQFVAYKDIAGRYFPHVFGSFRAAFEEHLPLTLVNDWDLDAKTLAQYRVVLLANAAALSDTQIEALRGYVKGGGGLVATAETSLCDALGRHRRDFALADLFGVSYRGRPKAPEKRAELDENFAVGVDENYWKQRVGVARLAWTDNALMRDRRLSELVPGKSVTFRGPLVSVSEPKAAGEVVVRMTPEGWKEPALPAILARTVGAGRVVYLAAALDAALWSYAYPYQRRLLTRALEWAAGEAFPIMVAAPMCVQATYFTQTDKEGRRLVLHLFNGVNTTANHGLPVADVPLREEMVPIHGIRVRFEKDAPKRFHVEPGGVEPKVRKEDTATIVELPPLEMHALLVGEW